MVKIILFYLLPYMLEFIDLGSASLSSDDTIDDDGASLHPLDPLTETEIKATVSIIKNYKPAGDWIFVHISLREPEKAVLLKYFLLDEVPPSQIPRRSFTVLLDRDVNLVNEVIVNLDTGRVEMFEVLRKGIVPAFTADDFIQVEKKIRKNPEVQERCKRLGWTNMSLVNGNPWPMTHFAENGKQTGQLFLYGRMHEKDNQYAHPFDFVPIVDTVKHEVIRIEELPTHDDFDGNNKEGIRVPRTESNYDPEVRPGKPREDLRPIRVSQSGTSFTFVNNLLSWQKFKMRLGFNGREGLVIYQLSYNDEGKVRPLFYRMSLSEIFSSYGDPRPPFHRKHVFDVGAFGLGVAANQLKPQMDCLGEVVFMDAVLHNTTGHILKVPKAVCINEEDAGILWKHTDYRNGKGTITRSQRLVLTMLATFGGYDYLINWRFYQDASIELNVKLMGVLNLHLLAEKATPAGHGTVVSPLINAQYHHHLFTLRLDAEIDGNRNTVSVMDVVPGPGATGSAENPFGNAFTTRKTVLSTATNSRTNVAPEKSRSWHITNPNSIHPFTHKPVAWKLMPVASPPMMLQPDSPIRKFAGYLDYDTWVTPYQEDQLFAAGYYLNNSGLPEWVGRNPEANINNTDIVFWHNFGMIHIPRAEDFPVMPAEQISIFLKPVNFFLENPAMDVPQPKEK